MVAASAALFVPFSSTCQRAAENGLAADDGSVSGDGRSSRCCTVGELLRDRDCVSAIAVTLVCDEHGVLKIDGAHPHIRKKPRMCGAPGCVERFFYLCRETCRGCPILARPLRKSGSHTDRTMALPFTPRASQMSVRKIKIRLRPRRRSLIMPAVRPPTPHKPQQLPHPHLFNVHS